METNSSQSLNVNYMCLALHERAHWNIYDCRNNIVDAPQNQIDVGDIQLIEERGRKGLDKENVGRYVTPRYSVRRPSSHAQESYESRKHKTGWNTQRNAIKKERKDPWIQHLVRLRRGKKKTLSPRVRYQNLKANIFQKRDPMSKVDAIRVRIRNHV